MPTTRPRHALTETPELAEALRAAARRWPQDRGRPSVLLRRLIDEGVRSIEPDGAAAAARSTSRLDALQRISGSYTGLYEPGYLESLRGEWPE